MSDVRAFVCPEGAVVSACFPFVLFMELAGRAPVSGGTMRRIVRTIRVCIVLLAGARMALAGTVHDVARFDFEGGYQDAFSSREMVPGAGAGLESGALVLQGLGAAAVARIPVAVVCNSSNTGTIEIELRLNVSQYPGWADFARMLHFDFGSECYFMSFLQGAWSSEGEMGWIYNGGYGTARQELIVSHLEQHLPPGQWHVLLLRMDRSRGQVVVDGQVVGEALWSEDRFNVWTTGSEFTLRVGDFAGSVDYVAVRSDIPPAGNSPPVAVDQVWETLPGQTADLRLQARDADGDALTWQILDPPAQGILSGAGSNRTYTAGADFAGDSFTFCVSDGRTNSAPATVRLVQRPAARTVVRYSFDGVREDAGREDDLVLTGNATITNGCLEIGDMGDGAGVLIPGRHVFGNVARGQRTAAIELAARIRVDRYLERETPGEYMVSDLLELAAWDDAAQTISDSAVLFFGKGVYSDAPVIWGSWNWLVNDEVLKESFTPGQWHTLRIRQDATGYRVAVDDQVLVEQYVFPGLGNWNVSQVLLAMGDCAGAVDYVEIRSDMPALTNSPPVVEEQMWEVACGQSIAIRLRGRDADDDPLDFEIVNPPQHGVLSGSGVDRVYTAAADCSGDTFTYRALDGWTQSAVATVRLIPPLSGGHDVARFDFDGNWLDSLGDREMAPRGASAGPGAGTLSVHGVGEGGIVRIPARVVCDGTNTSVIEVAMRLMMRNPGAWAETSRLVNFDFGSECFFLTCLKWAWSDQGYVGWIYDGGYGEQAQHVWAPHLEELLTPDQWHVLRLRIDRSGGQVIVDNRVAAWRNWDADRMDFWGSGSEFVLTVGDFDGEIDSVVVRSDTPVDSGGVDDPGADPDSDGLDNLSEHLHHTDPNKPDTDHDGRSDSQEIADGTDPTDPRSVLPAALAFFGFDNPRTWEGGRGSLPVIQPVVRSGLSNAWQLGVEGGAVDLSDGTARLAYPYHVPGGGLTISPREGTVRFWFKPAWSSVSNGGSGPQELAALVCAGLAGNDNTNGCWGVFLDASGDRCTMLARDDAGHRSGGEWVGIPGGFVSNRWRCLTFTCSSNQWSAFVDGGRAGTGAGLKEIVPPEDILNRGLHIGTDAAGQGRSLGAIDALELFNHPLEAAKILEDYQDSMSVGTQADPALASGGAGGWRVEKGAVVAGGFVTNLAFGSARPLWLNTGAAAFANLLQPSSPVKSLTAGHGFSLLLNQDGTVAVWGENSSGQCNPPAGLDDVASVAAGFGFAMALRSNGTVAVWGDDTSSQCHVPAGLSTVAGIAAGQHHCLALMNDGTVTAWGDNSLGQCDVPAGLSQVVRVVAGYNFSLALKADGTLAAWGLDDQGQGTVNDRDGVAEIAAGAAHGVAIRTNDVVISWGCGTSGQGISTPSGSGVAAIAANGRYSMLLGRDGGVELRGELCHGTNFIPDPVRDIVAVAAGYTHCLALRRDGAVAAWGLNGAGQCEGPPVPCDVRFIGGVAEREAALMNDGRIWSGSGPMDLADVRMISVGGAHTIALKADGTVVAWGDNTRGQCAVPLGLTGVIAVSAGERHSMALKSDGTVVVFGDDAQAQCRVPSGLAGVTGIAAGRFHCLALKNDGTVTAWGGNAQAQCEVPAGLCDVTAIAAGALHSLALKADGTVVLWGAANSENANIYALRSVPPDAVGIVAVAAGSGHCLALRNDGVVVAWGNNFYGQCERITGLSDVRAISAWGSTSFAVLAR